MAEEIKGLELKGEIESKPIDITEYIGKKTAIAKMKIMQNEVKGEVSYYLNVVTQPVGKIEDKDIVASRNFGLKFDKENGGVGWSNMGKLSKFLEDHKITDYKDLIGKEVICIPTDTDNNGQKWLTF